MEQADFFSITYRYLVLNCLIHFILICGSFLLFSYPFLVLRIFSSLPNSLIREHIYSPQLQMNSLTLLLDQSPAFLTSEDFIRSNEIVRTKWHIY